MFGIFKSKNKNDSGNAVEIIAEELFKQITNARDEAKSGNIINEKIFNDRLNSMFAAGYLIGFVDEHLDELFDDDSLKKESAKQVFETMFPGVGMDFVKAKLSLRQKAAEVPPDDQNYKRIASQCAAFDKGMSEAQDEVEAQWKDEKNQPQKLTKFLLLGEIPL